MSNFDNEIVQAIAQVMAPLPKRLQQQQDAVPKPTISSSPQAMRKREDLPAEPVMPAMTSTPYAMKQEPKEEKVDGPVVVEPLPPPPKEDDLFAELDKEWNAAPVEFFKGSGLYMPRQQAPQSITSAEEEEYNPYDDRLM